MTNQKRVLILGGTGEAAQLADRIAEKLPEVAAITALAGRTHQPVLHGATRVGGFGGAAGLTEYLQEQQIDLLIDATHPFAAQISVHAAAAAAAVGIPQVMLLRPAWQPVAGDRWLVVDTTAAAAAIVADVAERVFLSIGRQDLAAFAHLPLWFLMRMIDPPAPDAPVPPGMLFLQRGPFSLADEQSLLQEHAIGAIVSKNSGGDATYAKIVAAREVGLPVVMVQRPVLPDGERVETVEDALSWIGRAL